jgi:cytoskeletal protein RodZ
LANKEQWDNEVYHAMRDDERKQRQENHPSKKQPITTRALTFTVILMFIIVSVAIVFTLWNNQTQNTAGFATGTSTADTASIASSAVLSSESSASSTSSSTSSSSSSADVAATYTVVQGDYPELIAEKTGVSWTTIMSLNNVNAKGYYNTGAPMMAGDTLKLK